MIVGIPIVGIPIKCFTSHGLYDKIGECEKDKKFSKASKDAA